tara:strand:- start:172 stop:1422 length:1251 start_codon:yes stop_codon:yes gene_type:complete
MAKDRWLIRKPGDLIPRTGAPVTRPTAPSPIGTGVPPRSDVLQINPQVGTIPAGGIASIPEKPPETFYRTYDQETRDYWDERLEHNALRQNPKTGWGAERSYMLEAAGDVLRELTGPTGFTREGQEKRYLNEKLNRLKREAHIVGADYMATRPDFGPAEGQEAQLEEIRADIAQIKPKSEEVDLAKMILDNIASGDPYGLLSMRIDQLRKKLDLLSEEEKDLDRSIADFRRVDEASRMARAREMGFNVDMPLYHGTSTDIQEFVITKKSTGEFGPAVYLTNLPKEAGEYAGTHALDRNFTESRNIVPVYARLKNPMHIRSPNEFWDRYKGKTDAKAVEAAKADGFDGIIIERPYKIWDDNSNSLVDTGEISVHYVVFDPKNVRSRFAEFDPAQSESPDISKAHGGFIDKPLYERTL